MVKTLEKLRKLEERINKQKVEKKIAERSLKEVEDRLKEKGIKIEDLESTIKEKEKQLEDIETEILKKIKEANDVLDSTTD